MTISKYFTFVILAFLVAYHTQRIIWILAVCFTFGSRTEICPRFTTGIITEKVRVYYFETWQWISIEKYSKTRFGAGPIYAPGWRVGYNKLKACASSVVTIILLSSYKSHTFLLLRSRFICSSFATERIKSFCVGFATPKLSWTKPRSTAFGVFGLWQDLR